jgi:hypothetical protein
MVHFLPLSLVISHCRKMLTLESELGVIYIEYTCRDAERRTSNYLISTVAEVVVVIFVYDIIDTRLNGCIVSFRRTRFADRDILVINLLIAADVIVRAKFSRDVLT